MKNIFITIVLIIVGAMVFTNPVQAQTNVSPNNYKLFNSWHIPVGGYSDSTSISYYNGRVDTLPNWRSAQTTIAAAGAKLLSLTFQSDDTCHATVVVKSKVRGAATSTYATILTDSIYNWSGTVSTNYRRELSLKDGDSDLFDNVDQEFIVIVTYVSFGNDTEGTATMQYRLNWAP